MLHDAADRIDDLAGVQSKLKGPVTLGCFSSFASNGLPAILEGFPRRHPDVTVDVTVGSHDELLPALDTGMLDAAIVDDMLLRPGDSQRAIYDTELQAVLPADHPLAGAGTVELAQLADDPFIMYESSPSTSNTPQVFAQRGLSPNIVASMPQVVLVQPMVERGLGYALLMSRPHCPAMTVEGRHVAVLPLPPPASLTMVAAIWPRQMTLSPRAEALLDFAVEVLCGSTD